MHCQSRFESFVWWLCLLWLNSGLELLIGWVKLKKERLCSVLLIVSCWVNSMCSVQPPRPPIAAGLL